ncbi:hypothetical protein J2857_002841 [Neorhizobium galegae]|uniref:hypothetical protein n=1 Tax=Neorhizobium galegae TaxID=399 RepID=UPI001AE95CE6|nr:hypothetical protein [Neorhizobium galegae]MBP2560072.1 hypothetical protein [Neorhizobium galegae]
MSDPSEPIELDLEVLFSFYDSLRDGRLGSGARADLIQEKLVRKLGRFGESGYWLAGASTIDDWRLTTRNGTRKNPVTRPKRVLAAFYESFNVDISKDKEFTNYFYVDESVFDLIEVRTPTVEPLGPDSEMSHKVRIGAVRLNTIRKDVILATSSPKKIDATLGFINISIIVTLPSEEGERKPNFKLIFLSPAEPETQDGKVIGTTVRLVYPDRDWKSEWGWEWEMLKPPSHQINLGQLVNASLMEFASKPKDNVKIVMSVENKNFYTMIHLLDAKDCNLDEEKTISAREKLIAQVLKKRLDMKGRYEFAGGNIMVEGSDD